MTEQKYKELTAAVKESGIPLPMQKELQDLLDKEFNKKRFEPAAIEEIKAEEIERRQKNGTM